MKMNIPTNNLLLYFARVGCLWWNCLKESFHPKLVLTRFPVVPLRSMATASEQIGLHRLGRSAEREQSRGRSRSAPVPASEKVEVVDGYEYLDVQMSDYLRHLSVRSFKGESPVLYVPEGMEHLSVSVAVRDRNITARSPFYSAPTCIGDSWGFENKSKKDIMVSCYKSNRVRGSVSFVPATGDAAASIAAPEQRSKRRSRSKSKLFLSTLNDSK